MSGFGLAWSLFVAAGVGLGGIVAFAPTSDRPGALADRVVQGAGLATLLSRLVALTLGGVAVEDPFASFGGDAEFWFVATGALVWAARTPGPVPWRNASARLLDVVPGILLAYGSYRLLCPIRRGCIEGPGGLWIDVAMGAVLIGVALAVRFAWSISIGDRLLLALAIAAAVRVALGFLGADDGLRGATLSSAVLLLSSVLLGRSVFRSFRAKRMRRQISG